MYPYLPHLLADIKAAHRQEIPLAQEQLQTFEEEMGFALFKHNGRGIVVTDAGRKLYDRSPAFFLELDALMESTEKTNFMQSNC